MATLPSRYPVVGGESPSGGADLPAGLYLKDYAIATRASGDITLNQTAVTDVDTGLDLVLDAASGDLAEYGISGMVSAVAVFVGFDVYTVVGGAPVNPFGPGVGANLTIGGVRGWNCTNVAQDINISGAHPRLLVSGDISAGTVRLRLRYAKNNTTARILMANSTTPLTVWAKVWSSFA